MLIFSGNIDGAVPWNYTYYCLKDLLDDYDTTLELSDKFR